MGIHEQLLIIGKVILAIILGGIIGLEREWSRKPAGLRTHMLICGATAFLICLGNIALHSFGASSVAKYIKADPFRLMQAIITGISFLGAGTIFLRNQKEQLEGLTTAASILFTSGIGMCVGVGNFLLPIVLTIIVLVILVIVGRVERYFHSRRDKSGNESG